MSSYRATTHHPIKLGEYGNRMAIVNCYVFRMSLLVLYFVNPFVIRHRFRVLTDNCSPFFANMQIFSLSVFVGSYNSLIRVAVNSPLMILLACRGVRPLSLATSTLT